MARIPFDEDLGIYCRALLAYRERPSQINLALVALTQRVLWEKGRHTYKKRGQMGKVERLIDQVNHSEAALQFYARQGAPEVVKTYPLYQKAGLV